MKKLIYTTLLSIAIWVVAALINTLLFITVNVILMHGISHLLRLTTLALACSFSFSAPGIIIFWFLFFACYQRQDLFQILLKTALITSFLSGTLFFSLISSFFSWQTFILILNAVIAALVSLFLHRSFIVKICQANQYV